MFSALQESDSSSSDDESNNNHNSRGALGMSSVAHPTVIIPSYEDLSTSRADEETVLQAVYADDFRRLDGVWGCARLEIDVRPPDVELERIGSQLWYVWNACMCDDLHVGSLNRRCIGFFSAYVRPVYRCNLGNSIRTSSPL